MTYAFWHFSAHSLPKLERLKFVKTLLTFLPSPCYPLGLTEEATPVRVSALQITTYHKIILSIFAALLFVFSGALGMPSPWARTNDLADALLVPRSSSTDGIIGSLQARLRERPTDSRAYSQLGAAYLQKARESGDPAYYPKAEAVLNKALELKPDDFEAMISLGSLALSRHQFRDALVWAEHARVINPYRALIYGISGDAHIELGAHAEAEAAYQKMVNVRPDLNSYSRVSYARELLGNIPGAIEAMHIAVDSGESSSESTAWCRVQLGHLYLNYNDDLAAAESEYRHTLADYSGYIYAIAGLARIYAARGDYQRAIELYTRGVNVTPRPEFVIALGDVYQAAGQPDEAARQYALVRVEEQLYRANGVDSDLEMALFDVDHNHDLAQALARAREQMVRRPSIKAADLLAWALYKTGDYAAAQQAMKQALRLGTRDPLMLFHAGMIAYRLGDHSAARDYLSQALKSNSHFSLLYADEARRTLAELGG